MRCGGLEFGESSKVLTPDLWDARCPRWAEASRAEQADLLKVAYRIPDRLTDWERDFLSRANRALLTCGFLARKQIDVLDGGLLKKLWVNDPQCWD